VYGRVKPVQGLSDEAFLVTRYPFDSRERVASWGWWSIGVWIGPYHTYYGDGSICAYEVADGTWTHRDPLWKLLHLNTLWVVRQMHSLHFGRWPGKQILHTAYERLRDHRPGELCGCGSIRLYDDCHRGLDTQRSFSEVKAEFDARCSSPERKPSREVLRFLFPTREGV
jgi:hypothetical protein